MRFTESKHQEEGIRLFLDPGANPSGNYFQGFLIILFLFVYVPVTSAQRKVDLGILGGASYYMGEINMARHFYKPSPAIGAMARYNFNARNSLRFHLMYGSLRGDDLDFNNDFQQARAANFKTSMLDMAINMEFNFFPYETGKRRKDKFTPYATGGMGYSHVFDQDKQANLAVIFTGGAGVKMNVTKTISTGMEWSFRKTFNDLYDGLENPGPDYNRFYHNNDWYYIVGIFVTYKFLSYLYECPAYD